jgi:hypothetical protein
MAGMVKSSVAVILRFGVELCADVKQKLSGVE